MKAFFINCQRGAILAFTLLMLLLLTLAGTRMIQQNKQQLNMAMNMRAATQRFADAEAKLAATKTMINTDISHIDKTGTPITHDKHQCAPIKASSIAGANYRQQILLANQPLGIPQAALLTVSCLSTTGITPCTSYDGHKLSCFPKNAIPNNDCTGKTLDEVAVLFNSSSDVCYQHYDPQAEDPDCDIVDPPSKCQIASNTKCPIEVYKIDVQATNADGTTREIISDFKVKCGS